MHRNSLGLMSKWLRRIRGAIGMGVTWAVAWAFGGLLIGLASFVLPLDWFFEVFDAPLPAMAIPGFFAGAFFSAVLGIAARKRRLVELSMPKFIGWGALGGLLLTLFPLGLVAVGLATPAADGRFEQALLVAVGPFVVLSAACAAGTLALARRAERRQAPLGASVAQDSLDAPAAQPVPSLQKFQDREKA